MSTRTYEVPMFLPVSERRIVRKFTLREDRSSIFGWRILGYEKWVAP